MVKFDAGNFFIWKPKLWVRIVNETPPNCTATYGQYKRGRCWCYWWHSGRSPSP